VNPILPEPEQGFQGPSPFLNVFCLMFISYPNPAKISGIIEANPQKAFASRISPELSPSLRQTSGQPFPLPVDQGISNR
jgi:hypothetical protein